LKVGSVPHDAARTDPPSWRESQTKTARSPAAVETKGPGHLVEAPDWASSAPTASFRMLIPSRWACRIRAPSCNSAPFDLRTTVPQLPEPESAQRRHQGKSVLRDLFSRRWVGWRRRSTPNAIALSPQQPWVVDRRQWFVVTLTHICRRAQDGTEIRTGITEYGQVRNNSEGLADPSPGLPRHVATPGFRPRQDSILKGLHMPRWGACAGRLIAWVPERGPCGVVRPRRGSFSRAASKPGPQMHSLQE
jgi:hypothetical protein